MPDRSADPLESVLRLALRDEAARTEIVVDVATVEARWRARQTTVDRRRRLLAAVATIAVVVIGSLVVFRPGPLGEVAGSPAASVAIGPSAQPLPSIETPPGTVIDAGDTPANAMATGPIDIGIIDQIGLVYTFFVACQGPGTLSITSSGVIEPPLTPVPCDGAIATRDLSLNTDEALTLFVTREPDTRWHVVVLSYELANPSPSLAPRRAPRHRAGWRTANGHRGRRPRGRGRCHRGGRCRGRWGRTIGRDHPSRETPGGHGGPRPDRRERPRLARHPDLDRRDRRGGRDRRRRPVRPDRTCVDHRRRRGTRRAVDGLEPRCCPRIHRAGRAPGAGIPSDADDDQRSVRAEHDRADVPVWGLAMWTADGSGCWRKRQTAAPAEGRRSRHAGWDIQESRAACVSGDRSGPGGRRRRLDSELGVPGWVRQPMLGELGCRRSELSRDSERTVLDRLCLRRQGHRRVGDHRSRRRDRQPGPCDRAARCVRGRAAGPGGLGSTGDAWPGRPDAAVRRVSPRTTR